MEIENDREATKILLSLSNRLVNALLDECEIIEENPPIKVKVRIKRKKP